MSANQYEGMVWNGHRWMAPDPVTGQWVEQKTTIWQKSRPWQRVVMVTVFAVTILVVSLVANYGWPF